MEPCHRPLHMERAHLQPAGPGHKNVSLRPSSDMKDPHTRSHCHKMPIMQSPVCHTHPGWNRIVPSVMSKNVSLL